MRVAERVLNELIVTADTQQTTSSGTIEQGDAHIARIIAAARG